MCSLVSAEIYSQNARHGKFMLYAMLIFMVRRGEGLQELKGGYREAVKKVFA